MFTGIIEQISVVEKIEQEGTNYHFTLCSPIAGELKIDQSLAHDGCCLTVVALDREKNRYTVTAMKETMDKTNLGTWKVGTEVNIERSMRMDGRFDGHIVQGHVDRTAVCTRIIDENGSWRYFFAVANSSAVCVSKSSRSTIITIVGLLKASESRRAIIRDRNNIV